MMLNIALKNAIETEKYQSHDQKQTCTHSLPGPW